MLNAMSQIFSEKIEDMMILQGKSLALQNETRAPFGRLSDAEFKVFSQYGEDGILQYLIGETKILPEEKIFVEFGVQDYKEANTRFLLQSNVWSGLVIDSDENLVKKIQSSEIYWRYNLTARSHWIDKENINDIIYRSNISGGIGLLSIDIDGNDYWVWSALTVINPILVVIEWNSVFGARHSVSIPYDATFNRLHAHYSGLYWGASMRALETLGREKGYTMVGTNEIGNNLFFVRSDRLGRIPPVNTKSAYVQSGFRDSRSPEGELTFLAGESRYEEIKNLPIIDLSTGDLTTLEALDKES